MKPMMVVMMISAMIAPLPAGAQDPGDAPERGVARISVISGDVTVRRGDTGELIEAEVNEPLVSLDHILTDDRAHAEIQFDWATLLRLAPDSEVRLAELREGDYLVQAVKGTLTLRVLKDSKSKIEISAPTTSLVPRADGIYRITVRDDFSTEMTVRAGDAEVLIENTRDFLRSGQTLFVTGDPLNPQRAYRVPTPLDDWDRWNESRDRELARNDSYQYVSRDIYGAEDLSDHGQWVYDAPYGWVWVPRVDAAWAPYRVGRWSWIDYYGWTWVSGDPWGWAPYHYGRWYYGPRYGWAWYPGGPAVRYTWRPALVGFFGWGTNIGWVPLAPYEAYRPWYGLNRTAVVNNVTVINHIDAVNSYHNARFISGRSGVTSLASTDFWRHRTTVNNYVIGTDRDFNRASDATRLISREPDRGYRQPSNRRDDGRSNVRTTSSGPSETARRTPSGRSEPASDRGRNSVSNVSPSRASEPVRRTPQSQADLLTSSRSEPSRGRTSVSSSPATSRQPVETVRRNEPSRVRTFESSPSRTETPNRSEPRRTEPATIGRSEPSRGRSDGNERPRVEPPSGQAERPRTDSPQTVRSAEPRASSSQGQGQSQPQGNPGRGRGNNR